MRLRRRLALGIFANAVGLFANTVDAFPVLLNPTTTQSRSVPFILLFESGSGSSWLIKELAALPQFCVVLFEPIDNSSLTTAADHFARLRWLEQLWTPPQPAESFAWPTWRARMEAASVFGQLPLVKESLNRCGAGSIAFGLKARLSRLLNRRAAVDGLRVLLARYGVRVLRLGRRNRIKQALTEYRRLNQGLGHFKAASGGAVGATEVEPKMFARALVEVERSHRLANEVLSMLSPGQPVLNISYEELLHEHAEATARVHSFLGVSSGAGANKKAAYVKATPDRLACAVANYAELCREYESGPYKAWFEEGCAARCESS